MLTSGGRVAATAGGPVVTSVVPVTSLSYCQRRNSLCSLLQNQDLPQQCTFISDIVGSNAIRLQVTQKQTLVHVRRHSSLGDFTDILLRAVGHIVSVSVRILANAAITSRGNSRRGGTSTTSRNRALLCHKRADADISGREGGREEAVSWSHRV